MQLACKDCGLYHGPKESTPECEGPRGHRWDKIDKDKYGLWLCPMCPEPGEETPEWAKGHGQRGISVVWETFMSIADTDESDAYAASEHEAAMWRVECINGHVLMTSQDFGEGDEETPPVMFRPDMLVKK